MIYEIHIMVKLISWLSTSLFSNPLWASTDSSGLEKQINHRLGEQTFELSNQNTEQIVQEMTCKNDRNSKASDIRQASTPDCGI